MNITAEIALRLAQGSARQVTAEASQAIKSISGRIDLKLDPAVRGQLSALSGDLGQVKQGFGAVTAAAQQAGAAAAQANRIMASSGSAGAAGLAATSNAARGVTRAYGEAAGAAENFGRLVSLSTRRFAAFQVGVGAVNQLAGAFRNALGEAVGYELAMNKLAQVSEEGKSAVGAISAEVARLSTSLGVARGDLAGAAVDFKAAGLSINDTRVALEAVAKAQLAPSFNGVKQIVDGSIASLRQFGDGAKDLAGQLGSMNAVAAGFAVEAGDLVTVVQKAGGAFKATGGNLNELLALFTSIRGTTREGADEISTGLRTIFGRLQRNETVEALKSLGVNLRYTREEAAALSKADLQDQFVGSYEAVRRLSEGLGKLRSTDARYSAIAEQVGGVRELSKVLPLVQSFGDAQKALNVAKLGGVSLDVASAQRQDALATKFGKVKEEFLGLTNSIVESKGFKGLVDGLTTSATAAIHLLDAAKPLLPLLAGLAAIKLGQGVGGLLRGAVGGIQDRTATEIATGVRQPRRFARGGVVPGSGNLDSEHALLMPGEFVVRKQSAQRIGYETLHQLNDGRESQHFSAGGKVRLFENLRRPAVRLAAQLGVGLGGFFAGGDLKAQKFYGEREVAEGRSILEDDIRHRAPAVARAYATGGSSGTDTVKALLTPGEFVLNRSAVDRLGVHTLRHMNQHGEVPQRFASGGPVRFAGGDVVPQAGDRSRFAIDLDTDRTATRVGFQELADTLRLSNPAVVRFNRAIDAAAQALGLTAKQAERLEVIYGLEGKSKKNPVFKGFVGYQDEDLPLPAAAIRAQESKRLSVERRKIPTTLTQDQIAEVGAKLGANQEVPPALLAAYNQYDEARKKVEAGIPLNPTQANLAERHAARVRLGKSIFTDDDVPSSQEIGPARAATLAREQAAAAVAAASLQRAQPGGVTLGQSNIDRLLAGTTTASVKPETHADVIASIVGSAITAKAGQAQTAQAEAAVQTYAQMQSQLKALKAEGFFRGDLRVKGENIQTVLQEALARKAAGDLATPPPAVSGPVAPQAAAGRLYPLVPYVRPTPAVEPPPRPGPRLALPPGYLTGSDAIYGVRPVEPQPSLPQTVIATEPDVYGLKPAGNKNARANRISAEAAAAQANLAQYRRLGVVGVRPYQVTPEPLTDREQASQYQAQVLAANAAAARAGETRLQRQLRERGLNPNSAAAAAAQARLDAPSTPPTPSLTAFYRAATGPDANNDPTLVGRVLSGAAQHLSAAQYAALHRAVGNKVPFGLGNNLEPSELFPKSPKQVFADTTRASSVRSSSVEELLALRSGGAIDARGGSRLLSGRSIEDIAQQQYAKVQKELTTAIGRQLRVLEPAISATEARKKAEELAASALQQNATVLRNASGAILGTETLGRQLSDQGLNVAGTAPGFAGVLQGARSAPGRALRGIRNSFSAQGGFAGVYGLSAIAPLAANAFAPDEAAANAAATTGNSSSYISRRAGGGLLEGAAFGGAAGVAFGPVGAAVGAATGALVGFVAAVRDAERSLNDANLAAAVHGISERLGGLASGKILAGAAGENEALTNIAAARLAVNRKADDASSHFFGGTPEEEVFKARKSELQLALGGQSGNIAGILTKSAQDVAAANPRGTPADLVRSLGAGLNGELVRLSADIRGTPVRTVLDELAKSIQQAQRNIAVGDEGEKARRELDKNVTGFGRLADAVGNAAAAVQRFDVRLNSLQTIFSGSTGAVKVSNFDEGLKQVGQGSGEEFKVALGRLSGLFGEQGGQVSQAGLAADAVARILPGVLGEVGRSGLTGESLAGNSARTLLLERLLPGSAAGKAREDALATNPELAKVVNSVTAALNARSSDPKTQVELGHKIRDDSGHLSDELLEPSISPFKRFGESASQQLKAEVSRVVEEIATARNQLTVVGESTDKVTDIHLAGRRVAAQFDAERTGRPADSFLSLENLQNPFQSRQERLTGRVGAGAVDVGDILARLGANRQAVIAAGKTRDEAVGTPGFGLAAANFDRLTAESSNLQRALHGLAEVSTRAAAVQEKLSALSASRDARLNYGEKYLLASPEQRARMQHGQALVGALQKNPADFQRLDDEEKKIAIESLSDFGNSKLANGQTGLGLKRQVLEGALAANGGAPALSAEDAKQEASLQGQLKQVFEDGEKAQRAVVQFQKETHSSFLTDLGKSMDAFFARLAANLAQEKVGNLRNQKAAAEVEAGDLAKQSDQRLLLGKAGITKDSDLQAARGQVGDVADYLAVRKKLEQAKEEGRDGDPTIGAEATRGAAAIVGAHRLSHDDANRITDEFDESDSGRKTTTEIEKVLNRSGVLNGFSQEQREKLVGNVGTAFPKAYDKNFVAAAGGEDKPLNDDQQREVAAATVTSLAKAQLNKFRLDRSQSLTNEQTVAAGRLTGSVKAANLNAIGNTEQDSLLDVLKNGFAKPGETLEGLTKRLEANADAVAGFGKAIEAATAGLQNGRAVNPTPAEGHATGGTIFSPMGSDTVPAMLTPGEFVVRKAAAQKHLALLQHLNRGGASYYAEGGEVDFENYRGAFYGRGGRGDSLYARLAPRLAEARRPGEEGPFDLRDQRAVKLRFDLEQRQRRSASVPAEQVAVSTGKSATERPELFTPTVTPPVRMNRQVYKTNRYRETLGLPGLGDASAPTLEQRNASRANLGLPAIPPPPVNGADARQRLGLDGTESRVGLITSPTSPRGLASTNRLRAGLGLPEIQRDPALVARAAARVATRQPAGPPSALALLGLNDRFNARSLADQQSVARGVGGLPGDDAQAAIAGRALTTQRESINRQFNEKFGPTVYGARASRQVGDFRSRAYLDQLAKSKAGTPDASRGLSPEAAAAAQGRPPAVAPPQAAQAGGSQQAITQSAAVSKALDDFAKKAGELTPALNRWSDSSSKFLAGVDKFDNSVDKFVQGVSNFPSTVTHTIEVRPIEVVNNGGGNGASDDKIRSIAQEAARAEVLREFKNRLPHA